MALTTTKIYTKDKPLFERLKRMPKADLLKVPVTTVPFCVRAQNALQRANIATLGELIVKKKFDLLKLQNMGRTSVEQLESYLTELGLHLATPANSTPTEPEHTTTVAPTAPNSSEVVALLLECQKLTVEAARLNEKVMSLLEGMAGRAA